VVTRSPDPRGAQALALLQEGRAELAEVLALQVDAADPGNASAALVLGMLAGERGQLPQALAVLTRASAAHPRHPELLFRLALAQRLSEAEDEALATLDRALALAPGHPALLNLQGLSLKSLGRSEEALVAFDAALSTAPRFVEALHNRGVLLRDLGRLDEALASLTSATALQPRTAELHEALGKALHLAGRAEEALASFRRALELRPNDAALLSNVGAALHALGRFAEAATAFELALQRDPSAWFTWMNLGVARYELKDEAAALTAYARAQALAPGQAAIALNRGNALQALGRFDEALAAYDAAAARGGLDAQLAMNIANTYRDMGRSGEAARCYEQALALAPDDPDIHFNFSHALLAAGDHVRGWPAYESRWLARQLKLPPLALPGKRWLAEEELAPGTHLLLHCEQGLGDTFWMCRFAPLLAQRGLRVTLAVQRPLVALLTEAIDPAVRVVGEHEIPADVDRHCPLLSVPFALKLRAETIPTGVPYLRSQPERVARWRAVMGSDQANVGLAWSGNPAHAADRRRSLSLASLLDGLPDGPTYWCLQKDIHGADREEMERSGRVRVFESNSFQDTAAQAVAMDLVLSIDTSIANLAGALGCPLWVMLASPADFRWGLNTPRAPWYPTAQLWRQDSPGDWAGLLAKLRPALEAFLQGR
jgi:tetratricopeptide (TPR) repeat protein